jgi:hypothetical protein
MELENKDVTEAIVGAACASAFAPRKATLLRPQLMLPAKHVIGTMPLFGFAGRPSGLRGLRLRTRGSCRSNRRTAGRWITDGPAFRRAFRHGDLHRKGHALRASLFPVGEDVHGLNPFIMRRVGPTGNAWGRLVPPLTKPVVRARTPSDTQGTKRRASRRDHSRMSVALRCVSFPPLRLPMPDRSTRSGLRKISPSLISASW